MCDVMIHIISSSVAFLMYIPNFVGEVKLSIKFMQEEREELNFDCIFNAL